MTQIEQQRRQAGKKAMYKPSGPYGTKTKTNKTF